MAGKPLSSHDKLIIAIGGVAAAVVLIGGPVGIGSAIGLSAAHSKVSHTGSAEAAGTEGTTAASSAPSDSASGDAQPAAVDVQPVVEVRTETTTEDIPFAASTVDDATMPSGTTKVVTAGVVGTSTTMAWVTYTDGAETARKVVSKVVTTEPVTQVTAVGTYVAPPPPPAPRAPAAAKRSTGSGASSGGTAAAPATSGITPGAFCADAQRGVVATGTNGKSYTCGSKGPDANGHLHWNA